MPRAGLEHLLPHEVDLLPVGRACSALRPGTPLHLCLCPWVYLTDRAPAGSRDNSRLNQAGLGTKDVQLEQF